jgi:hypothetical protein
LNYPIKTFYAQGNGRFISVTSDGQYLTSPDGVTWPVFTWPNHPPNLLSGAHDEHHFFTGLAFGGGHFIAYGKSIIMVSNCLPGSDWESSLTVGGIWTSATFTGTNWVLTDNEGRTATSLNIYPANWSLTAATIILPGKVDDTDSMPF